MDNFLIKILKGVPKSHVYRIVRAGEVRVNKKRASVQDRLDAGDVVRLPPVRVEKTAQAERKVPLLTPEELPVLYEDRDILIAAPALILVSSKDSVRSAPMLLSWNWRIGSIATHQER